MKYLIFFAGSGKAEKAYWKQLVWKRTDESEEGKEAEFVCAFAERFFDKKFYAAYFKEKMWALRSGRFYRKQTEKSEKRRLRFPREAGLSEHKKHKEAWMKFALKLSLTSKICSENEIIWCEYMRSDIPIISKNMAVKLTQTAQKQHFI